MRRLYCYAGKVNALQLTSIRKTYRQGTLSVPVLDGVSLEVGPRQAVALLGPSGSGKTTLLQIAGLLDTPDSGEVLIDGQDMSLATDSVRTMMRRRHIGYVYQFSQLLPEMTAVGNVALPLRLLGMDTRAANAQAHALLSRLSLAHRAEHYPSELSGGEQQRVAIARAVVHRPTLLLADEPTGNLDPAHAQEVFELFMELVREQGLALLMVTHNHALAAHVDRTVQLDGVRQAA